MSFSHLVEFKGHREGIYLQFQKDVPMADILEQLRKRLNGSADFFKGARVIGILERDLDTTEIKAVRDIITGEFGLDMVEKPVKKSPKLIFELEGMPGTDHHEDAGIQVLGDTVFHRGNMRSGKRIESHGHLVVMGDVKPGAELIADGNIIVMGVLKGFAHAGRSGDESAYVAANKLEPTQLRIAGLITRSPDEGYEEPDYPELARIQDGRIIFEPAV